MSLNIFRSHVKVDTLLITCLLTTKGSMLLCRAHSLSTPSHPHPHPTPPSGGLRASTVFPAAEVETPQRSLVRTWCHLSDHQLITSNQLSFFQMSLCCKEGLEIILNLFSCRRTIYPFSLMSLITEMVVCPYIFH